jgi:diguanylate cyclase (GGDEF)-like protein
MPETPLQAAIEAAQRVPVAIHDIRILQARDDGPGVTASIGVATTDESQSFLQDLMIIADERLYMAKESGRAPVCPAAAA